LARILPHVEQDAVFTGGGIPNARLNSSDVPARTVRLFLCPSDPSASGAPRLNAGNLIDFPVGRTSYKGVSGSNWGDDFDQFQTGGKQLQTDWRNLGTNGSFDGLNRGDGVFYRWDLSRPLSLSHIADGTSSTFLIGEDVSDQNVWTAWPYANTVHGTCAIPPNALSPATGKQYPPDNWENTWGFRSKHLDGVQFAFADGSVHFISNSISLKVYRAIATHSGGEIVTLP
jgi:prepilin-type processing-associated H-X9-DG protein